jgi:membrane protease YdiL (CAAX protease family)
MIWKVSWPNLFGSDFFSSSYLFEIIIGLVLIFFHRSVPKLSFKASHFQFVVNSILVALFFSWFIERLNIKHPFIYLTSPFIQLVFIAPLLEEWIYRYSWGSLSIKSGISKDKTVYITGIIFALSHLPAIFYLGSDYYLFFALQFVYTFILGIICGRAFVDEDSLLTSVLSHMVFNLTFYFILF